MTRPTTPVLPFGAVNHYFKFLCHLTIPTFQHLIHKTGCKIKGKQKQSGVAFGPNRPSMAGIVVTAFHRMTKEGTWEKKYVRP